MIYIIRQGNSYSELPELTLRDKYQPDNILTSALPMSVIKERIKIRSLLSSDYLIVLTVSARTLKETISLIDYVNERSYVNMVLYCPITEIYNTIVGLTKNKKGLKFFDCYTCDNSLKEYYLALIIKGINPDCFLDKDILKNIRKRVRGHSDFKPYLYSLAWQDCKLTKSIINKLIPKYVYLKPSNFGRSILLYPDNLDYDDIDDLLYRFKYNAKPLVDNLNDFMKTFVTLYQDYLVGHFTEFNYTMYVDAHPKLVNENSAMAFIAVFKRTSPIKLIALQERVKLIKKEKDPFVVFLQLYRFIRFCKE